MRARPRATVELAIYVGWLLHRTLGGIVAGSRSDRPFVATEQRARSRDEPCGQGVPSANHRKRLIAQYRGMAGVGRHQHRVGPRIV